MIYPRLRAPPPPEEFCVDAPTDDGKYERNCGEDGAGHGRGLLNRPGLWTPVRGGGRERRRRGHRDG